MTATEPGDRLGVPGRRPDGEALAAGREQRLLGGRRRWRRREVASRAGVSLLSARKLWRALGFANVSDADVAFTDGDVEALARVAAMVRSGLVDEPTAITLARALGQTSDRLVSWQTEALVEYLSAGAGTAPTRPSGASTTSSTTSSSCSSTPGAGTWPPPSPG